MSYPLSIFPKSVPWDCGFVSNPQGQLFRAYGHSQDPTDNALFICNPLGEEAKSSFNVVSEFCASVWAEGWTIGRFDYTGTGDSEGEFSHTVPTDWLADGATILEDFCKTTKPNRIVLLGIRLGANIASGLPAFHKNLPIAGMIFWEPILDLGRYVRHLRWTDRRPQDMEFLDHYGWSIARTTLSEIERSLPCRVSFNDIPVCVIRISPSSALPKEFKNLQSLLGSLHSCLTHVRSRPFWEPIGQKSCDELVHETLSWLKTTSANREAR